MKFLTHRLLLAAPWLPACTCGNAMTLEDAAVQPESSLRDTSTDLGFAETSPSEASQPTDCEYAQKDESVAGCDYWAFSPHHTNEAACGTVALSNISSNPAQISVTRRSATLNPTEFMRIIEGNGKSITYVAPNGPTIPPGKTALLALFLGTGSSSCTCPFPAAATGVMVNLGQLGDGFHITSTEPLAAVFEHPYACPDDHTTNSTAMRAVPSWDTRYRDVGMYEKGRTDSQRWFYGETADTYPTWTAAVAGGTGTATFSATANGAQSFPMIAGNVMTLAQDDDYIGSLITATTPVGLWAGGQTEIPFNCPSSNLTYLQISPTSDWAAEYAAVPFPSRYPPHDLGSMWRLVGDVDGTVLTYDPAAPAGAPATIGAGGLSIFRSTTPFVVRSQDASHPFYVTQIMTGCADSTGDYDAGNLYGPDGGISVSCAGDPAIQHTPPAWEYGNHYVFFTDVVYPTTKLVFIRHRDSMGMHDVTLDCAGTLTGWAPVDTGGAYEYTYVTLSDGNFEPQVYPGGTCNNGTRVADSDGPFSIAVWQWGTAAADVPGISYYENVAIGYTVPARTVNPRTGADGGAH